MAEQTPNALEIAKSLRDDYRRLYDRVYGGSTDVVDPFLEVLFRTFGVQLETLYEQTGGLRLSILDELTASLGVEPRRARPAQTVLRFFSARPWHVLEAGTRAIGENRDGLKLIFSTDATLAVSQARIAMALVYQDGELQMLPGVEPPEEVSACRPSLAPVKARLGRNPCIYLAIEGLQAGHLSQHGLFFEVGSDQAGILRHLAEEPWCIADEHGEMGAWGILRPRRANAGIRRLEWLLGAAARLGDEEGPSESAQLPDGYYSNRCFQLPVFPSWRQHTCWVPWGMEEALRGIFPRGFETTFAVQRAWFRISFPETVAPLAPAINNILLHCVTASNVELFNQTVYFREKGLSIPVSREGGTDRFLVAPQAILGESGGEYASRFQPSADRGVGRYWYQGGRMELQPAVSAEGIPDSYANVRIWLTDGPAANTVAPGAIAAFAAGADLDGIRFENHTSASGGSAGEAYQEARQRFASALLSRDRVVTKADLETAARAFDRRIGAVRIGEWRLQRQEGGLQRVLAVEIGVSSEEFTAPEAEVAILMDELKSYLESRMPHGSEVSLTCRWT